MKSESEYSETDSQSGKSSWWRMNRGWPGSLLGRWSIALAAVFVILMTINNLLFMRLPEEVSWRATILPLYGVFMMLCGLAAGIIGTLAIVRKHERSWLVRLAVLPGLFGLIFLLGEYLVPH